MVGPAPVLEHGDDSGAAHVFGHVVTRAAQARGKLRRGLRFVAGEFRILVQIEIQRVRVGINVFNFFGRRSLCARHAAPKHKRMGEIWE